MLIRASRKCASRAERIAKQNLEDIHTGMSDLSLRVENTKDAVLDVRDQVTEGTVAIRAEIAKASSEVARTLQFFHTNVAKNIGEILQRLSYLPEVALKT